MGFSLISAGIKVKNYGTNPYGAERHLITSKACVCETKVLKIAKKKR